MLDIKIKYVYDAVPISPPAYAKPGDAGVDLCSIDEIIIPTGSRAIIRTGIAIAIPEGYCGFVMPRSGLAAKHGITVLNTPGLIDAGYRGEIMVILHNTSRTSSFTVRAGDRIAQLVIMKHEVANWQLTDELDETERSDGGLGHTGV